MKNLLLFLIVSLCFAGCFFPTEEVTEKSGWASYADTTHTRERPLILARKDTMILKNDAGIVIDIFLPEGVDSLYSPYYNYISPVDTGDIYILRIDFSALTTAIENYMTFVLDINGSEGFIVEQSVTFPQGRDLWRSYNIAFPVYALETFIANGATFKVIGGDGEIQLADIRFLIVRTEI